MKPALAICLCVSFALLVPCVPLPAQWELEQSNSTANLRGVVSLGGGVAWASGTNGTVLRTEDGGYVWQGCAVPGGAEKLDLRGIQAWDENVAVVMSSGKGALSRLWKTTDGCRSWKPLFTNPDKDGFWDALIFADRQNGALLGDPVGGQFVLMLTTDGGASWRRQTQRLEDALPGEGGFAASNSAMLAGAPGTRSFCTGGTSGPRIFLISSGPYQGQLLPGEHPWGNTVSVEQLESDSKAASAGCFSLAESRDGRGVMVGVGGDYAKPSERADTAWTNAASVESKQGSHFAFAPATTLPGGYRSAVAYDAPTRRWVAVGPTGTDLSTDDGRSWHALKPVKGEGPDTTKDWNAVSLPFAVGPHGRIGKLREDALRQR